MIDTKDLTPVMTLKQAAAYLQISKVHVSNVINGKVDDVRPLRCFRGVDGIHQPRGDPVMVVFGSCQESTPSKQERSRKLRRKRSHKGSLQPRKHGRHRVWVASWWEDGSRRSSVMGTCSQMTQSEAEAALADILRPINSGVSTGPRPVYAFEKFVTEQYLTFYRKGGRNRPGPRRSRS